MTSMNYYDYVSTHICAHLCFYYALPQLIRVFILVIDVNKVYILYIFIAKCKMFLRKQGQPYAYPRKSTTSEYGNWITYITGISLPKRLWCSENGVKR